MEVSMRWGARSRAVDEWMDGLMGGMNDQRGWVVGWMRLVLRSMSYALLSSSLLPLLSSFSGPRPRPRPFLRLRLPTTNAERVYRAARTSTRGGSSARSGEGVPAIRWRRDGWRVEGAADEGQTVTGGGGGGGGGGNTR